MRRIFTSTIIFASLLLANFSYTQNVNKPNIPTVAGLNVNSFSGGLFYEQKFLRIPGQGLSLEITMCYNSSSTAINSGAGPGWSIKDISESCTPAGDIVTVRHGDSRKDVYTKNGNNYIAPVGIFDSLVQYLPGKFSLRAKNGTTSYFEDSTHNRITKRTDRNNNTMTFAYTDSLLTGMTDASGRSLQFIYQNGHLAIIKDPNTSPPRQVKFKTDTLGQIITITDLNGNLTRFEYDYLCNMTKCIDPASTEFNITWVNLWNVASITSPLNSFQFNYNKSQQTTTVTEMVNGSPQTTTYKFVNGNMVEKEGNCCGYHVEFGYDNFKNIIQKTDANGLIRGIWTFEYDAKGNITKETDPLGGMKVWTYELVFNKVTSYKDKRGNITNYIYDGNGNLLHVNKPLGFSEHYTYDAFGNVISYTDGRSSVTQYQYNSNGDKTRITYCDGAIENFGYDNVGNQISYTNARGHTFTYTYDIMNRLLQSTDSPNGVMNYAYDGRSNLISVTDVLGHSIINTYDALSRKTRITTPAGTTNYTLDERGNILVMTDARGNATHYTYDSRNLLVLETDALGHSRMFDYDNNGNKTSETDFNNNKTTYTYDALNRLTIITDALSHSTIYGYDADDNRISVTDANGHTTNYVYDALNRLLQEQRPIGTTINSYDANGNKISMTDPNGHATNYQYDCRNRLTLTTNALAHQYTNIYDLEGNLVSSTDGNGFKTIYTYDFLNRRTSVANPMGETFTIAYDAVGRVSSRSQPSGNTITNTYDAADRLTSVSDNIGLVVSYTYDANSNTLTETDGNGHTTTTTYDALNRITDITDALGQTAHTGYDNNSNVTSEQDRNGHTTTHNYDVLNRKISTFYPIGNMTTAYDNVGNVISMTDANNRTTSYLYDANDRLTRETYADLSFKAYTYDAAGNNISRTDNNNATTFYTYDAIDRLTLRNYPGSNDDNFSYDNGNRMTSAINSNAFIFFSYDNADRMLSENLNGNTTSYSYNIPNRKRTLTYPGGRSIEENYDVRDRLSTVREGTNLAAYTYDVADRVLTRTYSNGTVATYSYNNNNWVTNLSHKKNTTTIAEFNYSFDNDGNKLFAKKTHRPTNSEKYIYDANDRITTYKEGTLVGNDIPTPLTQTRYNYDAVGNRTKVILNNDTADYTKNFVNGYTSIDTGDGSNIIPNYDANGNTLYDGLRNSSYDFENRLTSSTGGGPTGAYKYDALGRRIQKVTSGIITINYFYDGQRIIEERNAANTIKATYVYGIWIDEILNMRRGTDYFYHQNSLGSVTAITDPGGSVTERYEYDAYGKTSIYSGVYILRTSSTIENPYMFTGREYDIETKNYHYRARFYKTDWGRFGQWDPKGYLDEMSLYTYVKNNPVNYVDPNGEKPRLAYRTTIYKLDYCGAFKWQVQWGLSEIKTGFIIQTMKVIIKAFECDGSVIEDGIYELYYEAWEITAGASGATWEEKGLDDWEWEGMTPPCCTKGTVEYYGQADFYEGFALPGSFRRDNPRSPMAGGLRSTDEPFQEPAGTGKKVNRTLLLRWDCCKDNGEKCDENPQWMKKHKTEEVLKK